MDEGLYQLGDRFTNGIWYDTYNGDYAEIQRGKNDDGKTIVELVNPETGDVYFDMSLREWEEEEKDGFHKVSDTAIDDPVSVVNRALRIVSKNDINEMAELGFQRSIDLRWARKQVNIEEK